MGRGIKWKAKAGYACTEKKNYGDGLSYKQNFIYCALKAYWLTKLLCDMKQLTMFLGMTALVVGLSQCKKAERVAQMDEFRIFINYELGMHCTGFDFEYCCVLPPYNSIQAQVVKVGKNGKKPQLMDAYDPEDPTVLIDKETGKRYRLKYSFDDNSYSEGNKLVYWSADYDIDRDGNAEPKSWPWVDPSSKSPKTRARADKRCRDTLKMQVTAAQSSLRNPPSSTTSP